MLATSNKIAAGSRCSLTPLMSIPDLASSARNHRLIRRSVLSGDHLCDQCSGRFWVFAVIERALNRIWGATARTFWHGRALTIGMVGLVGLLLSLSVMTTSILVALREMTGNLSPRQIEHYPLLMSVGSAVWQVVFAAVSYLVTVALFVLVYRFMPRAQVAIRDTLPGAFLGGLLWEIAKYIFAWSLQYFHYDQIYGSVGAVVSVLTWSYVSSLILLFGAQLTAVFHREHPA